MIRELFSGLERWIEGLFLKSGSSDNWAMYLRVLSLLILLSILSYLFYWITKKLTAFYITRVVRKTENVWDDALADNNVFSTIAHIVPAIIFMGISPEIFRDYPEILPIIKKGTYVYLIIASLRIFLSVLRVLEYGMQKSEAFQDKPISSYTQLVRIILYIAAFIYILSILMDESPLYFLSAFGAMTALLMLIFKDTILGLVASVQMAANDMVRVGDWVEMQKFNADGDVIAINLNTVKIRNFDKTITSIPTYYFITDSFKNWRGMQESGGRRIKRSFYINVESVKFVSNEDREKYEGFYLIKDYIKERQEEIDRYNAERDIDTREMINGRRMTNLGVFRQYIEMYLRQHPGVSKEMTIMVRQLAMDDKGIPLEVYCFANTVEWLKYESIQADIFDHLLACASHFDVEIFQQPSGSDIVKAIEAGKRG